MTSKTTTYRDHVLRTAALGLDSFQNAALGLAGEAGEVADLVKKFCYHGHDFDRQKLALELGDVRYYLEWLAALAGLDMAEVEALNVAKLAKRYPEGFSVEASRNRKE